MNVSRSPQRLTAPLFAAAVFLSAFLLFQVQPLIGKCILPWFGGTPAVWTTCMLFFQVLLFGGYFYAHVLTRRCSPRLQAAVHALVLLCGVLALPIVPDAAWKPVGGEEPVLRIILLLAASVGLAFFALSATGPLLQRWFAQTRPGASPYRLYALSNVGSLLALVSYPFAIEPALAIGRQAELWSWGFVVFAGLCTACAWTMQRAAAGLPGGKRGKRPGAASRELAPCSTPPRLATLSSPRWSDRLLWFALALAASVMLLATTNQVCLDVAAVPFLWVLPLTLYLITFIVCFESDRWYTRRMFALALAVSMAGVCIVLMKGSGASLVAQVVIYFAAMFFCAMVCHGELAKLRPEPQHLTVFYLTVAAGGAAGGVFVGVVAPAVFPTYLELHLGMLGACLLALAVFFRDRRGRLFAGRPQWAWAVLPGAVVVLAGVLKAQADASLAASLAVTRNFYGVLRVDAAFPEDPARHQLRLKHGRILHGAQFVDEEKRQLPTAYYGRDSGVGCVLRQPGAKHVGVVGLGVGTVAAYARPGDRYRFYEINPEVIRLAQRYFTYLRDCPAETEIVIGDARLSLEVEPPQNFDVLVLDAFSGDAIPVHLLTREAASVYRRHVKPDGILAVHISNLHFDLRPVVQGIAEEFGLACEAVFSPDNDELATRGSLWALLCRDAARLAALPIDRASSRQLAAHHGMDGPAARRILWTDERNNLFEVLR